MPVYEYACATCGNRFEKLRPMSRMDEQAPCPDCGGDSRRVLSVFAAFSSSSNGETKAIQGAGGGCGGCGPGGCGCACGT